MSHVLEKLEDTVRTLAHQPSTPALYPAQMEAIPQHEPKFIILEGVKITLTMDKSSWPDGPWKNEPDELEWTDVVTGYKCLIKRSDFSGALCGYAGVREGHTLFGMDKNDRIEALQQEVELPPTAAGMFDVFLEAMSGEPNGTIPINLAFRVHGNITFSGKWKGHDEWFFGFDAGHAGDMMFMPNWKQYEALGINFCLNMWKHSTYRDVPYMAEQVTHLAEQLLRRE